MPFGEARNLGFNNPIVAALEAGNVIINKTGIFIYSSLPPASGNLIYSNTNVGGTDSGGNVYPAGEAIFSPGNGVIVSYNGITGWYAPTAALGNLKQSACAYSGGIDQFGNHVPIGLATYLVSGATPTYATEVGNGFIFVGPTLLGAPGITGASAPPTAAQVTVSSGHLAASTPISSLYADSLVNTVPQWVLAAVANPVAVSQALAEIQGKLAVSGAVLAGGSVPATTATLEAQGTLAAAPLTATIGSIANSVAETVIGTINIPASDAASFTSVYEWHINGNVNATGGAAMNVTLRMRIGGLAGNLLQTFGPFTIRGLISSMGFNLDGWIMCRGNGAGGHFDTSGTCNEQIVAAAAALHSDMAQFIARDTTVAYTVVLTAQMSVANANNSVQTQEVNCVRFSH